MPANSPREKKADREYVKGTRCFVANLPYEANWQDLKDHFKTVRPSLPEYPYPQSLTAKIAMPATPSGLLNMRE
eukprot:2856638-Pyramimonas_sp.AAC.3